MSAYPELPKEIEETLDRARRLEWWSLFWLGTIIAAMGLAMGGSQAMKTAWIEDIIGTIPPALFLIALFFERRRPTRAFPYGFHRAGTLAHVLAAIALVVLGGYLVWDATRTLVLAEHPTIGSFRWQGWEIWKGWPMIAALAYGAIPPVILGRKKRQLGAILQDKVLFNDAAMMRADWHTSVAAIGGILGIWFGYWWADAAAAALISLSILADGLLNARLAVAELMDGAPRRLESSGLSPVGERIRERLEAANPGEEIRIRQTGRFIRATVARGDTDPQSALSRRLADDDAWRLVEVSRQVGDEEDAVRLPERGG